VLIWATGVPARTGAAATKIAKDKEKRKRIDGKRLALIHASTSRRRRCIEPSTIFLVVTEKRGPAVLGVIRIHVGWFGMSDSQNKCRDRVNSS
jgi:hypothetical protein